MIIWCSGRAWQGVFSSCKRQRRYVNAVVSEGSLSIENTRVSNVARKFKTEKRYLMS